MGNKQPSRFDKKPQLQEGDEGYVPYATFTGRMMASIVDTLLSFVALVPLFHRIGEWMDVEKTADFAQMPTEMAIAESMRVLQFFAVELAITSVIVLIFWKVKGATPGKMFFNMAIVDANTLQAPSLMQYIIRLFGYIVSVVPFCLGFVWIFYDKRNQGFHDKLASTVVIKLPKNKVDGD